MAEAEAQSKEGNAEKNVTKSEEEEKKEEMKGEDYLDIAFCLDCTGSMNPYIQAARDNINEVASTIKKSIAEENKTKLNVQFALVGYRDHPPEDRTFIVDVTDFTPYPMVIQAKLNKLNAAGGGDLPEALSTALYHARYKLKWRERATKIIVIIGDAPPHGLETQCNDGFPNGDPLPKEVEPHYDGLREEGEKELNVLAVIRSIRDDLNGVIYSVACEPSLSTQCDFARDFYEYMAEYTKGRYLPLSDAELLPKVIIGSVKKQLATDRLMNRLDEEIEAIKKEHNTEDENKINEILTQRWQELGITTDNVSIGTLYRKERSRVNLDLLLNDQTIQNLAQFKEKAKVLERPSLADFRHLQFGNTSPASRRSDSYSDGSAPGGMAPGAATTKTGRFSLRRGRKKGGGGPKAASNGKKGKGRFWRRSSRKKSTEDTSHFDREFLSEAVVDTAVPSLNLSGLDDGFAGFTYRPGPETPADSPAGSPRGRSKKRDINFERRRSLSNERQRVYVDRSIVTSDDVSEAIGRWKISRRS